MREEGNKEEKKETLNSVTPGGGGRLARMRGYGKRKSRHDASGCGSISAPFFSCTYSGKEKKRLST